MHRGPTKNSQPDRACAFPENIQERCEFEIYRMMKDDNYTPLHYREKTR